MREQFTTKARTRLDSLRTRLSFWRTETRLFFGKVSVDLDEVLPLVGDFIFHENGVHGAFGFAQAAVDALIRVNIELVVGFMDTVHRTDGDTGFIFDPDAGFGDHIWHGQFPPKVQWPYYTQAKREIASLLSLTLPSDGNLTQRQAAGPSLRKVRIRKQRLHS